MITIAIRAMWDALRLLLLGIVCGFAVAVWGLVAVGCIVGGL